MDPEERWAVAIHETREYLETLQEALHDVSIIVESLRAQADQLHTVFAELQGDAWERGHRPAGTGEDLRPL